MNRELREALRFEDNPKLQFACDVIEFTGPGDTERTAEVSGWVTIAGEVREIYFSGNLGIKKWSQIVSSDRVSMNKRDYNIDPPTALLVIIRIKEEIDLAFEFVLCVERLKGLDTILSGGGALFFLSTIIIYGGLTLHSKWIYHCITNE